MKELITEISHINSSKKECRKFGISVGTVLLIIGMFTFYFDKPSYPYFLSIGGLLLITGLSIPKLLMPFQKVWMTFAVVMGFIMTRVILAILFYIIVTPVGIVAKIAGKDFLDLKIDKDKNTYWNFRDKKEYSKSETEKQY